MANYATNIFHARTENKTDLDKIEAFLDDTFSEFTNRYGDSVDAEFSSRWVYPEEEIKKLVESLEDKDKVYIVLFIPFYLIVIYYRFAAAVRPLVDLFSRKGNRLLQSCQCRRSAASEPQKSSSPSVERIFPHQPCQIVSATFWRQKNKSQRSQTGRKKGKKERLNYELQQIEIIGSERGSHRNGNENPSSRQAGHCGRKRNFIPIFWFRGYQRSVEYRYGQAHRW